MQPQPYFPEPEVVSENVALLGYDVRLGFIRRVADLHLISMLLVASTWWMFSTTIPSWKQDLGHAFLAWSGAVLVANLLRRIRPGGQPDQLSLWVFPFILGTTARLLLALSERGIHGEFIPIAALCAWIYRVLCGRDFSFLGLFTMSSMATILVLAACRGALHWTSQEFLTAAAFSVGYLAYYTYDLAALLQRRRVHEPLLALVDLYRDIFNFISYSFKVLHHWRHFRI